MSTAEHASKVISAEQAVQSKQCRASSAKQAVPSKRCEQTNRRASGPVLQLDSWLFQTIEPSSTLSFCLHLISFPPSHPHSQPGGVLCLHPISYPCAIPRTHPLITFLSYPRTMPYAYPPVLVLCFLILVPFLKLIFLSFSCPSYSFRPRAHPLSYCFFRCAVASLYEVTAALIVRGARCP